MLVYQSVRHCDECDYQLRKSQHGWFEELPYKVRSNIHHDQVPYSPGSTINLSRSQAAPMDQGQIEEIQWPSVTKANAASTETEGHHNEPGPPEPAFPKRAAWLKKQLTKRDWSALDVELNGGPNHKTVKKILKGHAVREDVLNRLANALSGRGPEIPAVEVTDIPQE